MKKKENWKMQEIGTKQEIGKSLKNRKKSEILKSKKSEKVGEKKNRKSKKVGKKRNRN